MARNRTAQAADQNDVTNSEETATVTETAPTQTLSYNSLSIDVVALPPHATAYLLQYGFAKSLQDAASGVVKAVTALVASGESEELTALRAEHEGVADADLPRAVADAKMKGRFDAILSGTIGQRTSSGPRASSFDVEFLKVAKEFLRKAVKAANMELPKDAEAQRVILDRYIAKNGEAIKAETERRMGAVSAADDLSDIFG